MIELGKTFNRPGPELAHDHETLCVRAAEIRSRIHRLTQAFDGFDAALRQSLWSPERRALTKSKPRHPLLNEGWQHLVWGGFRYGGDVRVGM
jgi:hypothetical protein